jgi:hypothetical protein
LTGIKAKEVNVWNFYTKVFEIIGIYTAITEVLN